MGNQESIFSPQQLEAYQDCTYFTKQDIIRIFKRFKEIDPSRIQQSKMSNLHYCQSETLPADKLENIPELRENPFRRRILEVFSQDNTGDLAFDDFLNMFSVFSEDAPREIKAVYAFKIYDFDRDNTLNKTDLAKTLKTLTQKSRDQGDLVDGENIEQSALTETEENHILEQVLKEADLDDNNELSYIEFEHVVSRAPDFLTTFHIRI
ncbi:calcium and integrin-binding family member 2-like isoform X1 [Biomphalaria glabrata]|uniref:Calcium and integrin-binding family member 2-like n=1 Tax=Biomphalaria glabrata TaxID=6526 RepID=A0A2C9JUE7_BIOGL|nr:calcium and integrin-binding family member 2-like [Biomphalaria glabrata]KAI8770099.1 calcium and integrin-binding family member 2-like isoform X1 [Biomphalaria glabrata]